VLACPLVLAALGPRELRETRRHGTTLGGPADGINVEGFSANGGLFAASEAEGERRESDRDRRAPDRLAQRPLRCLYSARSQFELLATAY
jgi:hypothetical protein